MKESLHVVPKKDVDKMFRILYEVLPINSPVAKQLRGVAYSNTFLAEREVITEEGGE